MHIVNLEEIHNLLLQVPELINSFERRDSNFFDSVKNWLIQLEKVLVNNRMAVASEIAVLRGVLISAERGVQPEGIVFTGKRTPRKVKDASAADVLRKANALISDVIKVPAAQIAEGERITRQLVAIAQQKGLIRTNQDTGKHADNLNAIWKTIVNDPELRPVSTHLIGLVGTTDALILLDRMLPSLK